MSYIYMYCVKKAQVLFDKEYVAWVVKEAFTNPASAFPFK